MTNKVLHAFPSPSAFTPDGDTLESGHNGMTLRDYFAAKALIAYHSDGNFSSHEDTANWCYSLADAMLDAR